MENLYLNWLNDITETGVF